MAVYYAKNALPRGYADPPAEVAAQLMQLPAAFGQQALGAVSLNLKKLAGGTDQWRLRISDWRAIFRVIGGDFVVIAIGLRKDVYERHRRMRLARHRDGVAMIELIAPERADEAPGPPKRRAPEWRTIDRPANPLTPFTDAQLLQIDGMSTELIAHLRALPPGIDIADATGRLVLDVDLAFLLADIWERPALHLETFDAGHVPTVQDLELEQAELARRIIAGASTPSFARPETVEDMELLLGRSIEEWMVYLHPSQQAIVDATFTGPARIRGGPGTGKTVVALHRARMQVRHREGSADKLLMTTFVSALPKSWPALMERLDRNAKAHIEFATVDQVARRIVGRSQWAGWDKFDSEDERSEVVAPLISELGIRGPFADPRQLLTEFDQFLSGRGITDPDSYLALQRRGAGRALGAEERRTVFAAYMRYRDALREGRILDWPHIRLLALNLAPQSDHVRFDGLIVDEAQDLNAVSLRLLLAVDRSPNHRGFLILGDGRQTIYPGGFSLRECGIDIVGRSRVLTDNWRNTWAIWAAAREVVDEQVYDDLGEEAGEPPSADAGEPRTMGHPVELHIVDSRNQELAQLIRLIRERLAADVDPGDMAVLLDTNAHVQDTVDILREGGVDAQPLRGYRGQHASGVHVSTIHLAKGLEFREVFIRRMAAADWPPRWAVPDDLEPERRTELMDRQLRTLFVGMTRACERLFLISAGPPCAPVSRAEGVLDVYDHTSGEGPDPATP